MRDTFNDLWAYNIHKNEFKLLNPGDKLKCEARKDHSMSIVGFHIFVYGGINSRSTMIEDPIIFNLCKHISFNSYRKQLMDANLD